MKRTHEPFWWALFSGGGVVAALVLPVLIFLTGPATRMGWDLTHAEVSQILANPLTKLVLLGVVVMSFFHCAHRVRHTFEEFGLPRLAMQVIFYSAALLGSAACGCFLLRI